MPSKVGLGLSAAQPDGTIGKASPTRTRTRARRRPGRGMLRSSHGARWSATPTRAMLRSRPRPMRWAGAPAERPMPCPDDDAVAAFLDGALGAEEAAALVSHLDGCAS